MRSYNGDRGSSMTLKSNSTNKYRYLVGVVISSHNVGDLVLTFHFCFITVRRLSYYDIIYFRVQGAKFSFLILLSAFFCILQNCEQNDYNQAHTPHIGKI